jgi:hypothetical protein
VSLAYLDPALYQPAQTACDQKQMQALFDRGFELGKNGTAFRKPGSAAAGQAQTKP